MIILTNNVSQVVNDLNTFYKIRFETSGSIIMLDSEAKIDDLTEFIIDYIPDSVNINFDFLQSRLYFDFEE